MQKRNHPKHPIIIAHRGASSEAPENTISAFQKAIDICSHWVELDVRLSQDGIPIVFHNSKLSNNSKLYPSALIHELPLASLKKIKIGKKFGRKLIEDNIPTLAKVLELQWNKTGLMIEIKKCPQPSDQVVKAVFDVLKKAKKLPPSLVIGSFSTEIYDIVQKMKGLLKSKFQLIGIIEKPEMVHPFVDRAAGMVALWYKIISPDLMKLMSDKKITVWTFTVDDPEKARALKAIGVKGIITNNPQKMLNAGERTKRT